MNPDSHRRGSSKQQGHPGSTGEMAVQVRPPRSTLKALRVSPCAAAVVGPLIEERHYLRSMPAVVCACFAVWLEDELVGGVVLAGGARQAHRLLQGAQPHHVVTLARLWLADELPANSESRVLGIVLRQLIREGRFKLVLSYADPAAGHRGTIYQASGWAYLGTTEPGRYLQIGETLIHPRTAHSRYGANPLVGLRRAGISARWHSALPKHRYAYLLDPAWQWRLRLQAQPYPKQQGRGPPSSRAARKTETVCGE